jgi:hypothetical protein
MVLPVHVDAYAGYRGSERPRRFELDGVEYRIYAWERQWRTPDAHYFIVRADGKRYVLRYDEGEDEWALLHQHDGAALFARPNLCIIVADDNVIRKAQLHVLGCERCHPEEADIPFEFLVSDLLKSPPQSQLLLSAIIRCPQCGNDLTETTLIEI